MVLVSSLTSGMSPQPRLAVAVWLGGGSLRGRPHSTQVSVQLDEGLEIQHSLTRGATSLSISAIGSLASRMWDESHTKVL